MHATAVLYKLHYIMLETRELTKIDEFPIICMMHLTNIK